MDIRPLDASDRAAAVALWHAAGLTRPWNPPEEDIARAVAGPTSAVLGGFDGTALVATAMVGNDGHRGWLYYVAVDPDRRRSGHGRALVAAAEAWLTAAGAPKIQLMVRAGNDDAVAFWRALGYAREETSVLSRWTGEDDPPETARR